MAEGLGSADGFGREAGTHTEKRKMVWGERRDLQVVKSTGKYGF